MRWTRMPMAMWAVFARSFQTQLTAVLGYDAATAKQITKTAKPKYKEIIAKLPKFEKGDRFSMNIIGCAMLGAFVLSMPQRPKVDRMTDYYAKAMMTAPMQWALGISKPKLPGTAALKEYDGHAEISSLINCFGRTYEKS